MMRARRVALVLLVLLTAGCAILEPRAKEDLSEGYALLYDLISKEKQSSQLSIINTLSPELKSLLERISETSKATTTELETTTTELETLGRIHPPLNLKVTHLPRIERAALESIEKETRREILQSKGVDLEFIMMSSQLAGMNYSAHLARSLAIVEPTHGEKRFSNGPTETFPTCTATSTKFFLPVTSGSGRTQIRLENIVVKAHRSGR
jgi:hypothetical protein